MLITSNKNDSIKGIKKLEQKKYREKTNTFLIEGNNLIEEAINANYTISKIILSNEFLNDEKNKKIIKIIEKKGIEIIQTTKEVFDYISNTESSQGIMGVVEKKENNNISIDFDEELIVILEDIKDPGNLGTILRTIASVRINTSYFNKYKC